jgi:hypothetical protein
MRMKKDGRSRVANIFPFKKKRQKRRQRLPRSSSSSAESRAPSES